MNAGRPITEEDLHAFVDRALEPAQQAEVAAYLARHADVAARILGYQNEREALRAVLAPFAEEPLPAELNLARMIDAKRRPGPGFWRAAAAAVLLLGLGGLGGWGLRDISSPAPGGIAALAQEAADSYTVYATDRMHPVELKAADRAELLDWVSQRLQRSVAAPDLSAAGYRFMGGRVVATAHGPAGMFMYDDDHGTRLVMLTRPMAVEQNAPMSQHVSGAVVGIAWANKGIGYTLVGPATAEKLHPLASEVRRQVDGAI
jgi:anti-sigma factor RsiW